MPEPGPQSPDPLDSFTDSVPAYYLNAFRDFGRVGRFEGLRVLEIGGSALPPRLVNDVLGAKQWVCVDIINHASGAYQQSAFADHYASLGVFRLSADVGLPDSPYVIFDGSAEHLPSSFEGHFDVVFSINALEHVIPLPAVIAQAHSALRPGGLFFAQFGPIWSCEVGSHFWVKPEFCFNAPGPMPPWGHLLLAREDLKRFLLERSVTPEDCTHALYQIYESDFVNRRFFEDYEAVMHTSAFGSARIEGLWERTVPDDMQLVLESRHPGRTNFSAYGLRIVAHKPALHARAGSEPRTCSDKTPMDSTVPDQTISLDEIIQNYPSFHRKPDGSPWFLGISGATLKSFASHIRPGMRTVETGAGFSSLAFITQGSDHTAICPDDYLEKNIRDWCDENRLDHSRFTYIQECSQEVVPKLTGEFDFVFVDGDHAFPMPIIDYYYLARRLKVGGLLAIDDVNIWTGDVLVKHLALDTDWEFVSEHDEKTCVFRLTKPYRDKGLWHQVFTLANSRHLPTEWLDGLRR